MSVFDLDHINTAWRLLLPPDKRLPSWLAWGNALMSGKEWKQEAFFTGYMTGALNLPGSGLLPAPAVYNNSIAYTSGQTVIYAIQGGGSYFGNNAVYQCISNAPAETPPKGTSLVPDVAPAWVVNSTTAAEWLSTGNMGSPFYWVKVQDNFVGAGERVMYNASRLVFEYALNKWFYNSSTHYRDPASGNSDIYIVPNVLDYDMLYMGPAGNGYNFIPAAYGVAMPYINSTSVPSSLFDFNIHIPVAVYNGLVSSNPMILPYEAAVAAGYNSALRDSIVRAFADQLNVAGMTYNIVTY